MIIRVSSRLDGDALSVRILGGFLNITLRNGLCMDMCPSGNAYENCVEISKIECYVNFHVGARLRQTKRECTTIEDTKYLDIGEHSLLVCSKLGQT